LKRNPGQSGFNAQVVVSMKLVMLSLLIVSQAFAVGFNVGELSLKSLAGAPLVVKTTLQSTRSGLMAGGEGLVHPFASLTITLPEGGWQKRTCQVTDSAGKYDWPCTYVLDGVEKGDTVISNLNLIDTAHVSSTISVSGCSAGNTEIRVRWDRSIGSDSLSSAFSEYSFILDSLSQTKQINYPNMNGVEGRISVTGRCQSGSWIQADFGKGMFHSGYRSVNTNLVMLRFSFSPLDLIYPDTLTANSAGMVHQGSPVGWLSILGVGSQASFSLSSQPRLSPSVQSAGLEKFRVWESWRSGLNSAGVWSRWWVEQGTGTTTYDLPSVSIATETKSPGHLIGGATGVYSVFQEWQLLLDAHTGYSVRIDSMAPPLLMPSGTSNMQGWRRTVGITGNQLKAKWQMTSSKPQFSDSLSVGWLNVNFKTTPRRMLSRIEIDAKGYALDSVDYRTGSTWISINSDSVIAGIPILPEHGGVVSRVVTGKGWFDLAQQNISVGTGDTIELGGDGPTISWTSPGAETCLSNIDSKSLDWTLTAKDYPLAFTKVFLNGQMHYDSLLPPLNFSPFSINYPIAITEGVKSIKILGGDKSGDISSISRKVTFDSSGPIIQTSFSPDTVLHSPDSLWSITVQSSDPVAGINQFYVDGVKQPGNSATILTSVNTLAGRRIISATDHCGNSTMDTLTYSVIDSAPKAIISPLCQTILSKIQTGSSLNLTGQASYDSDDRIIAHHWSFAGSTISNATSFDWLAPNMGTSGVLSLRVTDRYGKIGVDTCVVPANRNGVSEVCGLTVADACGDCEDAISGVCKNTASSWAQGPEWEAVQVRRFAKKAFFLIQSCELTAFEDDQILYIDLDGDSTTGDLGFEFRIRWDYLRTGLSEPSTSLRADRWLSGSGWIQDTTILTSAMGSGSSLVTGVTGAQVMPQKILELSVRSDFNVPSHFRWALVGSKFHEGLLNLPFHFYDQNQNDISVDGNPCDWRSSGCVSP
jgi:hypothetical protein